MTGRGEGEAQDRGMEKSGVEEEGVRGHCQALLLLLLSSSCRRENKRTRKIKSKYIKCIKEDCYYNDKRKGGKDEGKREAGLEFADKYEDCNNDNDEDENKYVPSITT